MNTDELTKLRSELARVTAELRDMKQERDTANMFAESALSNGDELKASNTALRALYEQDKGNYQCAIQASMAVEAQLRARVAELVERANRYEEWLGESVVDRDTLKQRNAELVAALRLFAPERFHLFSKSAADRRADDPSPASGDDRTGENA
jgi:uncharacterized coiled-coil DUF342 family protein